MAAKRAMQTPLVCHGHTRPIVELQFSPVTPDGVFLSSASKDGQPMLRNGETGDWVGTFQGHKGAVWSCVLNDAAVIGATGSADFTARVWNATTGDELHQFQHKHIVRTVSFARGDSAWQLCTGGAEKLLRIFDLQRPDAAPMELSKAHDNIRVTHWVADNKQLLVSYLDKPNVDVWDVRTGGVVRSLESKGTVTSIEVTPCGRFIVTADGKQVDFRDGTTFELLKSHACSEYEVESASFSPERGRFVCGGSDMWVRLHDYETGQELDVTTGRSTMCALHRAAARTPLAPKTALFAYGRQTSSSKRQQQQQRRPTATRQRRRSRHWDSSMHAAATQ
ncbi:Serine-threonine kinase receptor-associated protein [Chlorella vulgaris]